MPFQRRSVVSLDNDHTSSIGTSLDSDPLKRDVRSTCCRSFSLPFLALNTSLNVAILISVTLSVWLVTFTGARSSADNLAAQVQDGLLHSARERIVPYFEAPEAETLIIINEVTNYNGLIGMNQVIPAELCTYVAQLGTYFINASDERWGFTLQRSVLDKGQFWTVDHCNIHKKTGTSWVIERTVNATLLLPPVNVMFPPQREVHEIPLDTLEIVPVSTRSLSTYTEVQSIPKFSTGGKVFTDGKIVPEMVKMLATDAVWEGDAYFDAVSGRPMYSCFRFVPTADGQAFYTATAVSDLVGFSALLQGVVAGKQRMWLTLQRADGKLVGISHGKSWSHSDEPAGAWPKEAQKTFFSPLDSTDTVIAQAARLLWQRHGRTWDLPDVVEKVNVDSERWTLSSTGLNSEHARGMRLYLLQDYNSLMGELDASFRRSIIIFACLFVAGVALVAALSILVTLPLKALQKGIVLVRDMEFRTVKRQFRDHSAVREVRQLQRAFTAMVVTLESFSCYVPVGVVQRIIRRGKLPKLEMEERTLTVAFIDIKGFTELSAEMPPDEVVLLLSETLTMLTNFVAINHGIVDKYIGDCVMALWNAPDALEDHQAKACRTAIECVAGMSGLGARLGTLGLPPVSFRVGISSGVARIGNVGCHERFNYTAVGDTVNIASRLESANKMFGTSVLVTGSVYEACSERYAFASLGQFVVVGRREPLSIYELRGTVDMEGKTAYQWNSAMKLYLNRNFLQAREVFRTFPNTLATQLFLQRCDSCIRTPPPEDWSGVEYQASK
eukprot:TRINITY_DN1191_c0_g2_i1.p1 TRINITY_DN1191_c0_g2~~TRINITY_DN1191_c0_g2_i1.p1  ORF type:complete len:790 (+),score=104.88 TRINITY_DN1191_c0_g2_i1:23-2371(+)